MSKSILGLCIIVWFLFCCINVSVQEDDDINNAKDHRIKRKVSDYHQFLKDEKLTPEMRSLLVQVLRLERRKRALHKTRKKSSQFRNNSIYHNPATSGQKTKKCLADVEFYTLPTTRLESIDDGTVSLITKPMSFWLKPLSSDHEHIKLGSDKKDDLLDWSKNLKQQFLNSKKSAEPETEANSPLDIIDRKDEDSNDSEENKNEEIQGCEDVLGLEKSKEEELNKVIDDMLQNDDGDAAFHNMTNSSRKREVRFPLAIRSVTERLIPIPLNINREVSVLTKPSFYWLNQNKELVNNMLFNNSMQPQASNLNSAPSNARIVYYSNSSPRLDSNIAQNSSANQNAIPANSQPPGGKLEMTPLEALGLNRSVQDASNINISKEVSLTTKAPQYWLNMTQNSTTSNLKPKKAANTTTVNPLEAKPINISEEVSLLTKPSHYWTDPYMKNLNTTETKRIGLDGFTERVKMMAVNLSYVIPLVNKPASEWLNTPRASFGSSTALNSRQNMSELKQDGRGFNQLASTTNFVQTNKGNIPNPSASLGMNTKIASTNSPVKSEYQNISHSGNKTRSADTSVIRQPYAINEVPKLYFQQKQASKTKESTPQNPGSPITPITFQNLPNALVAVNSLQGQSNIPQVAELSVPKMLPERLFNNSPIAQSNLNMNPINFQNETILDKGPLLPQVYYTGALSEFNGHPNGFMQNNGRNNSATPNENSLAHQEEAAANISSGIPLDLDQFPKRTFLNETNLVQNLETYNGNAIENLKNISFTNSERNNHMLNNASSSQLQGPSSFVNNSPAIKPYSPNEADSQIVHNSQLQDQVNPFSTNEINQTNYNHNQSPVPFASNSLARNQFSASQTLSQPQRKDEKKRKAVKPSEQIQNTALTYRNALAKGSMVKTLNDSITMAFKNTTDNLNKAQKRDIYYERFGEQEPSYTDEDGADNYWKRGKPLNIFSDDKEYQPHIYRKREVARIETDEDLENEESSFKQFQKKKSASESESDLDKDEEDQAFHKTIKRASPVFNYDEERENDEQVWHQSFKRDSPVVGDESDYQDNRENVDSESGEDAVEKRGSILRESLKSRSAGIEINTQLDPNLENPKFKKFLQQYVSDLASIGRKSRSNGFGGSTKVPSLVEALQKYIRSSTPVYSQLSSTDLSTNELDIIDMNSLLRTVDVMSTVDRYGYALEEPPSTKIRPYMDFSIMTKMPFLLKSPFRLAINNIPSDNIVRKSTQVTPSLPIVKLRAAGTTKNKLSKKSAKTCFANDEIESDLLSFRNFLKEYHDNKNLPWGRLKDIFDAVNDNGSAKFGRSSGSFSGMFCNFNGSWLSTVAGMRIDLNQTDRKTFIVNLASKTPPPQGGLLYTANCTDWLLSARLPMKKTSIIQVTGINEKEKKLAVFLGECRVCNDKNLVYGHWIVLRESRDCEDVFSTQESYTDLWRQEGLHTLRLHNLQMLKMSLTTTDSTSLEGNVTISIANGTGGASDFPVPADTIVSIRPDGGAEAAVITGMVPPEGVTAVTGDGVSEVEAVNIVVGRKRIAIKL